MSIFFVCFFFFESVMSMLLHHGHIHALKIIIIIITFNTQSTAEAISG